MKKLALCWLACGLVPILSAQESATPAPTPTPASLPPGPLLNKAPDFAQWTITSRTVAVEDTDQSAPPTDTPDASPSPTATPRHRRKSAETDDKKPADADDKKPADADDKKPAAPPVEQKIVMTKTKGLRLEETTGGASPKIDRWCLADMQVTVDGSAAPVVMLPGNPTPSSDYVDYSKTDFPGFEWLTAKKFTGIKTVENQECLIFEDKAPSDKKGHSFEEAGVMIASINSATRLPVELQVGDEARIYEFGLAPTAMLTLPPEVKAVVEQWRKTMKQSALMPAKP